MNNPIDDKILEIDEKDPVVRAELILKVLYPYAKGFLDLWLEFMKMKNVYPFDVEKFIKATYFHDFSMWLVTQAGFNEAKEKMASQNLIYFGEKVKESFKNVCDFYTLEYMCANFIASYLNPETFPNIRSGMVMHKDTQRQVRKKLSDAHTAIVDAGGMFFSPSSKQYLLLFLLDDIQNDEAENLYNFGRNDEFWLRHLMTKELMKLMFEKYSAMNLEPGFVASVALAVTKVFYHRTMDKSDASELAGQILQDRIKDKEFRQKRIAELIGMV